MFSGLGLDRLHGLGPSRPGSDSWKSTGQLQFLGFLWVLCQYTEDSFILSYSLCEMGTQTLGDKRLCFSVSSSPACLPRSQHCAWRTQMCVFPTAALHPAFIPPMGATGQHGWEGDPTTPFTSPTSGL